METDRELRAALEQAQAALATSRRELDRVRADQSQALARLQERELVSRRQLERLEADRADALKAARQLEQVRRERDAVMHQLEQARRRASAAEREVVSRQVRSPEAPPFADPPSVDVVGPGLGRWLVRGAGLFLVGAFLAWGENLCGLFLGGGLLVASFCD